MMRSIAFVAVLALGVGLSACSSGSKSSSGAQEMAACCKTSADLKASMPKCCLDEANSQCCKDTKMGKAADCCKKAAEIKAKMPECCSKHAAGTPQACCTKK